MSDDYVVGNVRPATGEGSERPMFTGTAEDGHMLHGEDAVLPDGQNAVAHEAGTLMDRVPNKAAEQLGDGADGGGQRMNAGKLRMDLLPPEWDQALADVTTQGSKKYDERNWEQGMKWSTMVGCMKRHLNKFLAGERYDGDEFDIDAGTTGCHHLAMIAWNALALMSYDIREIGENDLPTAVQLELFDRVNAGTSDLGASIHENR